MLRRSAFSLLSAGLAGLLGLIHGNEAAAQKPLTQMGPQCVLPVPAPGQASEHARSFAHRFDVDALLSQPRTATFDVSYEGFSPEARQAFAYAVSIWERHVASDVPVRISAVWAALGDGILGTAGPRLLSYAGSAPGGIEPDTWYPYALADAIVGEDIEDGPGDFDVFATFNSDFVDARDSTRWHFDTTTPAPSNKYDFATVVLHELGHGLGFIGTGAEFEGIGEIGQQGQSGLFPYAYDLFVTDADGRALVDEGCFPNPSELLGEALTSEALFFSGQATIDTFGEPAPLYAPNSYLSGSSYSHLDEDTFRRGDESALMTPFLTNGERVEMPGRVTCAIFADMGWPLGPGCADASRVQQWTQPVQARSAQLRAAASRRDECEVVEPVVPLRPTKILLFPNPAEDGRDGCIGITTAGRGEVRIDLFDLLGRRVAGSASTERAVGVGTVDATTCSIPPVQPAGGANPEGFNVVLGLRAPRTPGVYLVRVRGDDFEEVRKWTVLR
jgi:hypothetical protein